jgi:hypothetical protein
MTPSQKGWRLRKRPELESHTGQLRLRKGVRGRMGDGLEIQLQHLVHIPVDQAPCQLGLRRRFCRPSFETLFPRLH